MASINKMTQTNDINSQEKEILKFWKEKKSGQVNILMRKTLAIGVMNWLSH